MRQKQQQQKTLWPFILPELNCTNRTWVQENHCIIKQLRLNPTVLASISLILAANVSRLRAGVHAETEEVYFHFPGLVLWVLMTEVQSIGAFQLQEAKTLNFSRHICKTGLVLHVITSIIQEYLKEKHDPV